MPTPRALALIAALMPGTLSAQEVIGTMSGTLNGEEREWYMTAREGMSQSDASVTGGLASVSLFGHASGDTVMSTEDALMLSWTSMDGRISAPEVRYLAGEGLMEGYVLPGDLAPMVMVNAFEPREGGYYVSGQIMADLGWSGGPGQEVDMSDSVSLNVTFEGTIPPLEE